MKQGIFKKISTFLLGSILALGVGVAVSAPHKDAMRVDAATTTVTDTLTRATTGVTDGSSTYSNWSNKTSNSDAVYAGNSAGGNNSIQLRSNNSNSGVITTASGGKVKKVTVTWQSSTQNGRTLNVYGKSSAYSSASDLYNTKNQGTLLGTIVKNTSTELSITGDYEYVGFCSSSGAMYLSQVQIEWDVSSGTKKLDTPKNVEQSSGTFTWDSVDNAKSYTILYDDTEITGITDTGYEDENYTVGAHTLQVKAVAEGYEDSDYSAELSWDDREDTVLEFSEDGPIALTTADDPYSLTAEILPDDKGLEISYSSSDETVATVSDSGVVTPLAKGTTTITASFGGNATYKPSSDTIVINVSKSEVYPSGESEDATMTGGTNGSPAIVLIDSEEIDAIKVGTSKAGGDMTITVPQGAYAITFRAVAWNGNSFSLSISGASNINPSSVDLDDDSGASSNSPFTIAGDPTNYLHTVTFDTVDESTDITLSSQGKRFIVWDAKYYLDGSITTYTVTYLKNDGSEESTSDTGAAPKVLDCTFEREGYSFARWNTQADGEGTDYSVGTTVSEDLTLYAIWQEYIEPIGGNVLMSEGENCTASTVIVGTEEKDAIKCGSGSKQGSMHITFTKAGITKIKVYIAAWYGNSEKLGVDVTSENATVSPSSLTLTKDEGIQGSGAITSYTLKGNETTYKFELTIDGGSTLETDILISAQNAANNRFVVWGATDLFAEYFIGEFNDNITCDSTGKDAPEFATNYDWTYFESIFNGLDAEEKGRIKGVTYTKSGSGASTVVEATGTTTQAFANAISRYDFIVAKYNPTLSSTSPWKDFIGRAPSASNNGKIAFGFLDNINSESTTSVILIISVISLATLGGTVLIRKRKEQE